NEWLEGYDTQREEWERQYAAAQGRWEAHKAQVAKSLTEEAQGGFDLPASASSSFTSEQAGQGTLADDASLAALREKLSSTN
ncbi:MAG: 30S ribosomal protein S1, partial [Curtobacterium sp.]